MVVKKTATKKVVEKEPKASSLKVRVMSDSEALNKGFATGNSFLVVEVSDGTVLEIDSSNIKNKDTFDLVLLRYYKETKEEIEANNYISSIKGKELLVANKRG